MMSEAKFAEPKPAAFPESRIRSALIEFWNETAAASEDDPFAREKPIEGTLYELVPEMDSQTIVNSFLLVEEILGMELPSKLVKAGGYTSQKQMLDDLLPKFRKEFEKNHK